MSQVRLGSAQIMANSLQGMLDMQRQAGRTQEQITSNQRLLTPADDPVAATRILQLDQELRQTEQFNSTLSGLENRLQREEAALDGISDLMLRARELISESGNGAMNSQQRGFLATELQGIVDNMAQFMNTRDASGEFIFAGFQGRTEPFVKGDDGRYRYQGDDGQRLLRIGPTTTVAANDSGRDLFMDIPASEPTLRARAHPDNSAIPPAAIGAERVDDPETFSAFHPVSLVIEFQPLDDVSPPASNYTVRQAGDGRVLTENAVFSPGERIEFGGASVRIDGEPAPGDSFVVDTTEKQGLLGNLEQFIGVLKSAGDDTAGRDRLQVAREGTMGNLENAQTRLLETRSEVGSRLNTVDRARDSNAEFEEITRQARSELADLDFAEAVSRLAQQSFVLESAQASFARVSRLSLFNFL